MRRAQWRQLARTLLRLANSQPAGAAPVRTQLDLMIAADHRVAAHARRNRWL